MTETLSSNGGPTTARQKIYVVLPAYNEEPGIGKLLDRLDEAMSDAGLSCQVIVADDGSDDATTDIVTEYSSRMPIVMKRHQTNQGLGATIRDGLMMAMECASDRDIVVTMDADDTHAPGLIVRMVRMIREGHDVVIASRYVAQSRTYGVPWVRRFLSYAGSLLIRCMFPTRGVRDFTCGFRAYRADVLRLAVRRYGDHFVDQDGFECMVDILLKLRRLKLTFGEVPIILRYDLKQGGSKMKLAKTARSTLLLLLKRRFGG